MKKEIAKKKIGNKSKCHTYVLYGYDKFDIDECFYLKIVDGKYQLVHCASDATIFDINIIKKKNKSIKSIDDLVQFFNTEEELKQWKFHSVKYLKLTK